MSAIKMLVATVLMVTSVAAFAGEPAPKPRIVVAQAEETVMFNTKTHKYHCASCKAAMRCTTNCVALPKSEALRKGGVPCHLCGGTCGR